MSNKRLAELASIGIQADQTLLGALELWLNQLQKWNRVWNLTGIRGLEDGWVYHVLDSLAIAPFLPKEGSIVDLGTGAGIPGTLLALVRPDLPFYLIDSNSKKIRFVTQMKLELGLSNVFPICGRIEEVDVDFSAEPVCFVSRAFSSLEKFIEISQPLASLDSHWLAMKGLPPDKEEVRKLSTRYEIDAVELRVPNLEGARNLVKIAPIIS